MAQLAGLRETRGHVIRAVRGVVFRTVTSVAVARDRCVVVILVAVRAGHRRMLPRQGEGCVVVVENRGRPGRGAVTHLALLRKIHRDMVRAIRRLILLLMAGVAGGRRQVEVPVCVALFAFHTRMRARERKRGLRMVKRRGLPAGDGMAHLALLRDPSGDMARIVRPVVVVQMATNASRAGQLEIAILVTLIALQIRVSAGQWESDRIMIEARS